MDAFYRTFVSLKTALYFNVAYSLKKKKSQYPVSYTHLTLPTN